MHDSPSSDWELEVLCLELQFESIDVGENGSVLKVTFILPSVDFAHSIEFGNKCKGIPFMAVDKTFRFVDHSGGCLHLHSIDDGVDEILNLRGIWIDERRTGSNHNFGIHFLPRMWSSLLGQLCAALFESTISSIWNDELERLLLSGVELMMLHKSGLLFARVFIFSVYTVLWYSNIPITQPTEAFNAQRNKFWSQNQKFREGHRISASATSCLS
jgi:hypothetical protein